MQHGAPPAPDPVSYHAVLDYCSWLLCYCILTHTHTHIIMHKFKERQRFSIYYSETGCLFLILVSFTSIQSFFHSFSVLHISISTISPKDSRTCGVWDMFGWSEKEEISASVWEKSSFSFLPATKANGSLQHAEFSGKQPGTVRFEKCWFIPTICSMSASLSECLAMFLSCPPKFAALNSWCEHGTVVRYKLKLFYFAPLWQMHV